LMSIWVSHFLAIINNAAVNTKVCWSLCFQFFWVRIPTSKITRSYSNSIFNLLRNHHTEVLISPNLTNTHYYFFWWKWGLNSGPHAC
jgi:hypothetical protein